MKHVAAWLLALLALGCSQLFSGLPEDDRIFDAPIDGLTEVQMAAFLAGDEVFGTIYGVDDGLGPIYNAASCDNCHPGEGRGHPSFHLIRFGIGNASSSDDFNYLEALGGPQLQNRAIPGYPAETLPPDVKVSFRTGPIVVGLGLLEAVPAADILARVDPDDANGDGISGRANYVTPPDFVDVPPDCACVECLLTEDACKLMGRFGRKARSITLLHQAARALHDDIGITSDFFTEDLFNPLVGGPSGDNVDDPEVPGRSVLDLAFYLRTLRAPLRRNAGDPTVMHGEQLFGNLGCDGCHVPQFTTGPSSIDALSGITFHPYTDLLLHDMGPGLADGVPDDGATGSEWRTTPLWGIGIISEQLGGQEFYLHDGRARSIEEAIGLHGGEAGEIAAAFQVLPESDREALLAFLKSL